MKKAFAPLPNNLKSVLEPLPYNECFKGGDKPFNVRLGRKKNMLYSFWRIADRLVKLTGAHDQELLEEMMAYIMEQYMIELVTKGEVTIPHIGTLTAAPNNVNVVRYRCDKRLTHELNTPAVNEDTFFRNARIMRDYEA
jgi:hypothetical protein